MDRREFLKWVGITSGASLLAGCDLSRKSESLIPYLVPTEDGHIPGEAIFSATSCTECPANCGQLARVRESRPVKLEGLPDHPVNDGALCIRGQSTLNRLYNVDRIRQPLMRDSAGKLSDAKWDDAMPRLVSALQAGNAEHAILTGRTSGSLSVLLEEFSSRMSVKRLPEFELFSYAAIREANRSLFGAAVVPALHPEKADVIITVGADVLETFENPVAFSRELARRKSRKEKLAWYHVEPHATMTGFKADHRVVARPGTEAYVLAFLLHDMADRRSPDARTKAHLARVPAVTADQAAEVTGIEKETLQAMAQDLAGAQSPLVAAGGVSTSGDDGLDVARLASLIQTVGGMHGGTIDFAAAPDYSRVGSMADVDRLVQRLEAGQVGTLILFDVDPVGRLAGDDRLKKAINKAAFVAGVGDMMTPTLELCDVVLPLSHALESWGDASPRAGTLNVIQPLLKPLFDTKSNGDILLGIMAAADAATATTYQSYVADRWAEDYGIDAADLIKKGFLTSTVSAPALALKEPDHEYTFNGSKGLAGSVLFVSPSVRWYDGRSEMLPLLKEIPDPLTSVTFDPWVSVGVETAQAMGVSEGDELELSTGSWSTTLPVRRQPGLARGVFIVQRGVTALPAAWSRPSGEAGAAFQNVAVKATGTRIRLAFLSGALTQEGRGIVPGTEPAHFGALGAIEKEREQGKDLIPHDDQTFYGPPDYPEYRWSMAIDLEKCVGCSACVAACYIENNVPMTSREEHIKGREMSWIRLEQYYKEDGSSASFVPTMCQQCDYAPCEYVCPVYASYHNNEGLNVQVYNRCVGTRYCSNNCPYKQRRFNWFSREHRPHPLDLMVNPDVSLRGKGIMEKCTFCIQRIRKARDVAKDENRGIRDGDLTPACAQSCPGEAIVFGNLLDENSTVHKWAHDPRSTRILTELGTSPGVFYLKKGNENDG